MVRSGVKHPRGPFTPKQIYPGVWLMLYYNNHGGGWYGRDPYFLACGREVEGTFGPKGLPEILWSQPEIVLYDREYRGGTSGGGYPDFIFVESSESNLTEVYITAAQKGLPQPAKSRSYLSRVEPTLVEGLLSQHDRRSLPVRKIPLLDIDTKKMNMPLNRPMLPATGNAPQTAQQGFSVMLLLSDHSTHARPGDMIFHGEYMALRVGNDKGGLSLNFSYTDGQEGSFSRSTGPMCTGLLANSGVHHVSIIADGGPNIVSFIVDGIYCDESWSFLPEAGMGEIPAAEFIVHSQDSQYRATVKKLDVYGSALRTSESVIMYRESLHVSVGDSKED